MKQFPTTKQLDELSEKHKEKIENFILASRGICTNPPIFNIGLMIEFLGDDWLDYLKNFNHEICYNKYLCNELWRAVKAKLNS